MNNERAKEYLEEMRVEYFCGSGAYDALGLAINSLDRDTSILKTLEDVRAEIILLSDKADRECKASNSYSVRERLRTKAQAYDDVAKMIDRKIAEVKGDKE